MFAKSVVVFLPIVALALPSCKTSGSKPGAADLGPLSDVQVEAVRVNWMPPGLGLIDPRPRISWRMRGSTQDIGQTAYQIVAAESPKALRQGGGLLWDSGKVQSAKSAGVTWAGTALSSRQRVYLSLRVWDRNDKASALSEPVVFEMGLLSSQDWKARWISAPPTKVVEPAAVLTPASWIWFPDENAAKQAPAAKRWFRFPFTLPAGAKVAKATVVAAANDAAEVHVNGKLVASMTMDDMAKEHDVTDRVRGGKNLLAVAGTNTGGPAGVLVVMHISLADGSQFVVRTGDDGWLAARKVAPHWNAAGSESQGWTPAQVVAKFNEGGFKGRPVLPALEIPAPYFSKSFRLRRPVKSARAYVSGLGYYELFINGKRVGDQVLDPAYTDYSKRVQYVTHDVTQLLNSDANALGIVLGNGFYNQHAADVWDYHEAHWRGTPRLLFQLEVTTDDDQRYLVASDGTWKVTHGPVRFDGIRNGEHYDARLEHKRWSHVGFDDSKAATAVVVPAPGGKLVARSHAPIRVTQTLPARSFKEVDPGVYVFDFGQNIAGWARLSVRGPAGTEVKLRFGEKLDAQGRLDRKAVASLLRQGEFEVDRYILRGDGQDEVWEPRFTYHGFQFVEVSGLAAPPSLTTVQARAINTDFESVGSLFTSDALVNQIHQATRWSYEANFQGIPTDCPHREKNGWTGDAHLAVDMGLFNYDNIAGYAKWVDDLLDAQTPAGNLPGIVPSPGWGYEPKWSGPSWDIALFVVPWSLYTFTGDESFLRQAFAGQQRYLGHLEKLAKGHLVDLGLGDWVPWKTKTPVVVTSTAHYLLAARLLARSAQRLGEPAAEARWSKRAQDIFEAFQKAFVNAQTGQVAGDEQTALALAITHDLVPETLKPRVGQRLVEKLEATEFHPDTGVIGAKALLRALSETGHVDVAYRVASQTTLPSWGYWMRQGATTLWEDWNGTDSRNHIFFGDIDAWYYEYLAGIRPDWEHPGFSHIRLAPQLVPGLDHVEAKLQTVRGLVESSWTREAGSLRFVFAVPPNSRATITLPVSMAATVKLAGQPLADVAGIHTERVNGALRVQVASGRYEFLVSPSL